MFVLMTNLIFSLKLWAVFTFAQQLTVALVQTSGNSIFNIRFVKRGPLLVIIKVIG
jgi:hypothetical protein